MRCHPFNLNRHGAGEFLFLADHCCFSLFIGIDVFLNIDKFLRFTVSRGARRGKKTIESTFFQIYIPLYVVYISLAHFLFPSFRFSPGNWLEENRPRYD